MKNTADLNLDSVCFPRLNQMLTDFMEAADYYGTPAEKGEL